MQPMQTDIFENAKLGEADAPFDTPLNENHRQFLLWKRKNPDVWRVIRQHCLRCYRDKRRFGIKMVVEYVRFNEYFTGYRDEPYRISNNHTAYIARDLVAEFPEMQQYIRLHRVVGEEDEGDEEESV